MENNVQNNENIDLKASDSLDIMDDDKIQGEILEGQSNKSDVPVEKTFNQSELDEIINKRISKMKNKHSKELEDITSQHKEQINIMELKYKALQEEYKTYKLDIEFHKEQKQLYKLGVSKEAIDSLKAIKLLGDENTYKVLREALVAPRFKGKTPLVSTGSSQGVNTKKVSFLD